MSFLERFHHKIYGKKIFILFTWSTRVLLFLGFLPSGLKKLIGERFTILGLDTPVGFFFEALYRTGFYWNFLGFIQLMAGILLLIPKTSFLGALLYFPIIFNIFVIVISMHFTGTPFIVGLMLLANIYLLIWDYKKIKSIGSIIFQ